MTTVGLSADDIIKELELSPHPEGGWYRRTFEDPKKIGGRPVGTAIYYLLKKGERSHWHRVDATELWHFYAGDPLLLRVGASLHYHLGNDFAKGEQPQAVVPAGAWQSAEPLGAWTLVGATVCPGFQFEGFELAPPDFEP
ncbi:MAG: cupin domain-containing protein [Pseudomonadota bacterium]